MQLLNKYLSHSYKCYVLSVLLIFSLSMSNAIATEPPVWYEKDKSEQALIHLYFFWSEKCPHCLQAYPDIIAMDKHYPWLQLHSLELSKHPENVKTYVNMISLFPDKARGIPAFMFCENLLIGYQSKQTTGDLLSTYLKECYNRVNENTMGKVFFKLNDKSRNSIDIPLLGNISANEYSLPVLTILIAGMDAFNPCAFFVLLFLLSMMVHTRSRSRMALIGSIFVFFSGAMYFLFMAAWLNLFIYLGEIRLITFIAGTIAIIIAVFNIKDYFWFKRGISLAIADSNKPKLFERMRNLLHLDSMVTVVIATIVLAIAANSYELLCTAGFPMVYTRILTLQSLSTDSYYLYLLLYNLIYVLPLLFIVVLFTIKLGSRKLTEHEGILLKLLSGIMMLLLGALLLAAPQLLNNITVAVLILLLALVLTWSIVKLAPLKKSD